MRNTIRRGFFAATAALAVIGLGLGEASAQPTDHHEAAVTNEHATMSAIPEPPAVPSFSSLMNSVVGRLLDGVTGGSGLPLGGSAGRADSPLGGLPLAGGLLGGQGGSPLSGLPLVGGQGTQGLPLVGGLLGSQGLPLVGGLLGSQAPEIPAATPRDVQFPQLPAGLDLLGATELPTGSDVLGSTDVLGADGLAGTTEVARTVDLPQLPVTSGPLSLLSAADQVSNSNVLGTATSSLGTVSDQGLPVGELGEAARLAIEMGNTVSTILPAVVGLQTDKPVGDRLRTVEVENTGLLSQLPVSGVVPSTALDLDLVDPQTAMALLALPQA